MSAGLQRKGEEREERKCPGEHCNRVNAVKKAGNEKDREDEALLDLEVVCEQERDRPQKASSLGRE